MTKWMTGGVAVLAIWFGAVTAAEAQGIQVTTTGPTCVLHNQSTVVVTGTVIGVPVYNYNITIVVNGVTRVNHKPFSGSGALISKGFNVSTWGLAVGQPFLTTIEVTYPGTASCTLPTVVIQGPTSYLPSRQIPSTVPAAMKEEEFVLAFVEEEATA